MRRASLVLSALAIVATLLAVMASPAIAYTPAPDDSLYTLSSYGPGDFAPVCWTIDCGDPALPVEVFNPVYNPFEYAAGVPTPQPPLP